jgi:hypothetical protein
MKYTAQQMCEAIQGSGGLVSVVARRLGCGRATVYRYRDRYETVRKALEDERETTLDEVEAELIRAAKEGNITAIIFYLKTIGKHRGYVERVQVEEYLAQELEWMMDTLERRLEPDVFRQVCGVLAAEGYAGDGVGR